MGSLGCTTGEYRMKYENIMKELIGKKIIDAKHFLFGRIDNEFHLKLDNGRTLIFGAEDSEFELKLMEINDE